MAILTSLQTNVLATTSSPITTSSTYVVIPEMIFFGKPAGHSIICCFTGTFEVHKDDNFMVGLFVDGSLITGTEHQVSLSGSVNILTLPVSIRGLTVTSAHSHTFETRWKTIGGSAKAVGLLRSMILAEIV